jgi:predicted Zn-dependent protease
MRLIPLFVALVASAPLSLAQAQPAPPQPAPKAVPPTASAPGVPHNESVPHDESVPHIHEEAKAPKDEKPIDYFWRKSDEAFHAGDYPRAIGLHRAIVALDPTETESYSVGAWLLWSLGKPEEAVQFLKQGLSANPKDPEIWDAAGQHYDLQKRFADSEDAYQHAVELSGKDADQMLRRRYAHAAQHNGDWNKSTEIWRALVAENPNDPVNRNNLARVEKEAAAAALKEQPAKIKNAALVVGSLGLLSVLALVPLRYRNRKA